jgi:hypothetical protein
VVHISLISTISGGLLVLQPTEGRQGSPGLLFARCAVHWLSYALERIVCEQQDDEDGLQRRAIDMGPGNLIGVVHGGEF